MVDAMVVLGGVLIWIAAVFLTIDAFNLNGSGSILGWALSGAVFLTTAWVLSETIKYDDKYPCLSYEVITQYNPATKSLAPMRTCVERGEWLGTTEGGGK